MGRRVMPSPGAVVITVVALGARSARGPADNLTGGPTTPSLTAITASLSALPVGNTTPTGIVIGRKELVLYFWGSLTGPTRDRAWRDVDTGQIDLESRCGGGGRVAGIGSGAPCTRPARSGSSPPPRHAR